MTNSSFAQNSDKAKQSYDKAVKMINKGKYTGVPALLVEAVSLESKHENPDRAFIGEIFSLYARFFMSDDYYGTAAQNYVLAALNYYAADDTVKGMQAFRYAAQVLDSSFTHNSEYGFATNWTGHNYVRTPITKIHKTIGDTTWFSMDIGTADFIDTEETGVLVTIYSKLDKNRNVVAYGTTYLVSIKGRTSEWYVVKSDEGKESGFTPMVGDLNYVSIGKDPDLYKGLLYELSKYHILFTDDYKNPIYDYRIAQMLTKAKSEEYFISYKRDIVRATAQLLHDAVSYKSTTNAPNRKRTS